MDSYSPTRSATPEEEESEQENGVTDRQLLLNAIQRVVNALGGVIDGVYVPGDSCLGCLKDLKKLWRLDDHDDDRTVARILWDTGVFVNDLVPILLQSEGKIALACADIMTAMTWPIDLTEELKELEEVDDIGRIDYSVLLHSHTAYKRALVNNPRAFDAILNIILPSLAKHEKERQPRDAQIISLVLHLLRNLAFIKTDQSEYITTLSSSHFFDLLLTLASNALHNTILLDFFHLLFRGISHQSLSTAQKATKSALANALEAEQAAARKNARHANSRHNRFGTTVSVRQHNASFVIHKQSAITREPGELLDASKKATRRKVIKTDEAYEALTYESSSIVKNFCDTFIESCFNPFFQSILKDIKSERPHVVEKDNMRLLFLTSWFMEYFLLCSKEKRWSFGLIVEILEVHWVVWVIKRMRNAMEERPKLYIELRLGTQCLTQLLLLLERILSDPDAPEDFIEAAETLQHKLYYNGEVLDIAIDNIKEWKEGGQMGFNSLDSSIHLSYVLLRLLEHWGKNKGNVYVRKRARRKARKTTDIINVEDANEEERKMSQEQMFTFEEYQTRFADEEVSRSLLAYLARWKEFQSPEQMKRVVGLIHRQSIKAKAEGLFFKVSSLNLFKNILAEERAFPKDQAYRDLRNVIEYIIKKFFKAARENQFLLVEAFFPKNRGRWKAFSSWEPPEKWKPERSRMTKEKEQKGSGQLKVKRGYSWSEQLGIAIKCLIEAGKISFVDWVKQILKIVIAQREKIIRETDNEKKDGTESESDEENIRRLTEKPSSEAIAKFQDYYIPYVDDEQEQAACKNQQLQLVFRLVKAKIDDETAEELAWFIPAAVLPSDLSSSLKVIEDFVKNPIDLKGKKASQLLISVKKRRRHHREEDDSGDEAELSDEDMEKKKRKKKEERQYKSAEFIIDSDAEFDEEAFFAKEREQREKNDRMAREGKVVAMKSTGTKKRRKKDKGGAPKKRAKGISKAANERQSEKGTAESGVSDSEGQAPAKKVRARPRPKPKPRPETTSATSDETMDEGSETSPEADDRMEEDPPESSRPGSRPRPKSRPRKSSEAPFRDSSEGLDLDIWRETSVAPSSPRNAADQSSVEVDSDLEAMSLKPIARKPRKLVVSDDDENE